MISGSPASAALRVPSARVHATLYAPGVLKHKHKDGVAATAPLHPATRREPPASTIPILIPRSLPRSLLPFPIPLPSASAVVACIATLAHARDVGVVCVRVCVGNAVSFHRPESTRLPLPSPCASAAVLDDRQTHGVDLPPKVRALHFPPAFSPFHPSPPTSASAAVDIANHARDASAPRTHHFCRGESHSSSTGITRVGLGLISGNALRGLGRSRHICTRRIRSRHLRELVFGLDSHGIRVSK
ncbi:hypothetical protein B0H16DRAFT_532710 [Mycena metata]|uniref:Uncharacterized protein n=1 Tax=Mycena metata TaxID=1033252 RepID=A0AAD7H721_9AGAR|nr:hypothetical protein B0H16DRAFT_532710 [Mycena metata]